MFCVNCFVFGKKDSKYRSFNTDPISNWSNLPQLVKRHVEKNEEHQTASLFTENFMRVVNREVDDISCTNR